MTRREQKRIVRELIAGITKTVLAKADKWPEDWDGHELRCLVRDAAAGCVCGGVMADTNNQRAKNYRNVCLVENLL